MSNIRTVMACFGSLGFIISVCVAHAEDIPMFSASGNWKILAEKSAFSSDTTVIAFAEGPKGIGVALRCISGALSLAWAPNALSALAGGKEVVTVLGQMKVDEAKSVGFVGENVGGYVFELSIDLDKKLVVENGVEILNQMKSGQRLHIQALFSGSVLEESISLRGVSKAIDMTVSACTDSSEK
jgi:hypothetical protein